MQRVFGTIRNQASYKVSAEAESIVDGRASILESLPAGHEVIAFRADSRATIVTVTADVRENETREVEGVGVTYEEAYDAYRAQIPVGWVSLGIRRDDGGA